MTTLKLACACALALIVAATATDAHAKKRKSESRELALLQRLLVQTTRMERELAAFRKKLNPDAAEKSVAEKSVPLPHPNRNRLAVAPVPIPDMSKTIKGYEVHIARSAKLKDLTPKLGEKVAEILAACPGARLTSGYRPGARVRGSGRPSWHSHYPSRAADMAGNKNCMDRHLVGWPGGLSTDYAAVRHYHISYAPGSREWGRRFAHYGSRYARHHRRYAAIR